MLEPVTSATTKKQKHTPCGYGLLKVSGCCDNKPAASGLTVYRGKDTVAKFLEHVIKIANEHQRDMDTIVPMGSEHSNCHTSAKGILLRTRKHIEIIAISVDSFGVSRMLNATCSTRSARILWWRSITFVDMMVI